MPIFKNFGGHARLSTSQLCSGTNPSNVQQPWYGAPSGRRVPCHDIGRIHVKCPRENFPRRLGGSFEVDGGYTKATSRGDRL